MELRNLNNASGHLEGSNIDSVIQRRPSLSSSLSSTSGYASSSYGGNTTPQLTTQRLTNSRNLGGSNNNSNPNLHSSWAQGQNVGSAMAGADRVVAQQNGDQLVNTVGPWVEQQKAQQASVAPLNQMDDKVRESDLNKLGKDSSIISNDNETHEVRRKNENNDINDANDDANNNSNADGSNGHNNTSNSDHDDDDELIPTAIVIKNIPFAIKKEQLLDVMTKLNLPLPYAFNYHFDNGVFRGLAFANFTSTEETALVVNQLNGREIGGRKLRVEYKKMLPLQERERIEREKREKRGQLEEQHRSTSNASLASLLSAASTTAATKNLSLSGTVSQTERLYLSIPNPNSSAVHIPPSELNFNDPEILDLYGQLLIYKEDLTKSVYELAFPSNMSLPHRKSLSVLCSFLNLLELYDNGLIIIRRKPGQQSGHFSQQPVSQTQPSHSSSMMNLNQLSGIVSTPSNNGLPPTHPELLRSQSQSAIQLPRLRQQASTPIQPHFPQYQGGHQASASPQLSGNNAQSQSQQPAVRPLYSNIGQIASLGGMYPQPQNGQNANHQVGTPHMGTSAAALLRSNNRSFVDVRSSQPLSNSFAPSGSGPAESPTSHHYFNNASQISQPSTPLAGVDINSRFAPFGHNSQLSGNYPSIQGQGNPGNQAASQQGTPSEDALGGSALTDPVSQKLSSISLSNTYDNPVSSSSGIWGPK
ncbi:Piso0_001492 [Millerozyma farinosa CBS 7064]|uniref:Piso0_001492 protein n=1 Tax=Pichia sorbitophila (strain ATCC MYA-4447 / BCRC 22081 / CBS 7064 / NBRC 10061 / NRRL Y-12695) TaxID=559304 RepID=G8YKY0_PICSO|nr:Piso0_001492 [Millerozyma farinosa CBS 7064]